MKWDQTVAPNVAQGHERRVNSAAEEVVYGHTLVTPGESRVQLQIIWVQVVCPVLPPREQIQAPIEGFDPRDECEANLLARVADLARSST